MSETPLHAASAEMELAGAEVATLSGEDRDARLEAMAQTLAQQISRQMFETLNTELDAAGQVFNQKGRPFDEHTILAALDGVQINFDTKPNLSLVIPPLFQERAKAALEKLASDPTLKRKHDEIVTRKWMEWRAREADRKLVG